MIGGRICGDPAVSPLRKASKDALAARDAYTLRGELERPGLCCILGRPAQPCARPAVCSRPSSKSVRRMADSRLSPVEPFAAVAGTIANGGGIARQTLSRDLSPEKRR